MLAQIDCTKESFELPQKTLAKPINEALLRMMHESRTNGMEPDGALFLMSPSNVRFANKDEKCEDANNTKVPIRFFIAGDMAFYAVCLGKNSATHWCHLCQLASKVWQQLNHKLGELWTVEIFQQPHKLCRPTRATEACFSRLHKKA
jgi:hypothetical protein